MSTAHILVIDDDDDLRETISQFLMRVGYMVSQAPNGQFVDIIMSESRIDLVLTDILMPVKEGIATIMDIRREFSGTKIIAMSGGGQISGSDVLRAAKALGAQGVITKPFDFDELKQIIVDVLNITSSDANKASYA